MPTESRSDPCGDEGKDGAVVAHIEVKGPDDVLLAPENRALAEKRLVRLLDMRLLPTVILIYLMNYIDVCFSSLTGLSILTSCLLKRNAVTAARVEGLQKDLNLTGRQTIQPLHVIANIRNRRPICNRACHPLC